MPYTRRTKRTEVEKMAELYRAGYSCGEIATIHGIKRQAVHVRLVRHGVTMRGANGKEKPAAETAP